MGTPRPDSTCVLRPVPGGGWLSDDRARDGRIGCAAGLAPGHAIERDIKLQQQLTEAQIWDP